MVCGELVVIMIIILACPVTQRVSNGLRRVSSNNYNYPSTPSHSESVTVCGELVAIIIIILALSSDGNEY